jgi:hypothetical protein
MDFLQKLLKLDFLANYRTYIGIVGIWLASLAEWNGFDVPQFEALAPGDLVFATLIALGIYEKAKAGAPKP